MMPVHKVLEIEKKVIKKKSISGQKPGNDEAEKSDSEVEGYHKEPGGEDEEWFHPGGKTDERSPKDGQEAHTETGGDEKRPQKEEVSLKKFVPVCVDKNSGMYVFMIVPMPMQLFYLCSKIYKNQYEFRHPNIGKPGLVDTLTIKEVALYLLGNPTKLSYTKYLEIVERMKWTSVSASSTFYKIEDGYCRISEDEYLTEDLLFVDESAINMVKKFLLKALEEKEYISLLDFDDFSELPEIGYEWNAFLLETIVTKYISELKIISPDYKDRRYQRSFIVMCDLGIESYSELVAYVFKNNGYISLSEGRFLSFLVVNGLAYKMIPKEIGNSEYFKVEKEYYVLI
ncbi:MAG: hypothetical protein Q4E51_10115 [Lachnospiraceae bacterium]|nr:hypothetical protein [Lachnospiraceae bacterium]MDO4967045.1 hypothetical protein [Lachnospiraceae bacterium]